MMKKVLPIVLMAVASLASVNAQTKEILSLNGAEGKLYAELQRPAASGEQKTPLVIICHGFTGNCNTKLLTDIADDLQAHGIASLRFDFNGHGKSEGEFQDMTVPNEIDDLKNVISWARRQAWVADISLLGHSQGGVVVSMTAGELGDSVISNLVLMAPAAVLRDDALRGNTQGAIYDPWNIQGDYIQLPWGGYKLGKKYVEAAMTLPIYETARLYTGPVLIIQGIRDRIVPYTYAERYKEGYKNCELVLMPDEDHGLSVNGPEASLIAANWLEKQLGK